MHYSFHHNNWSPVVYAYRFGDISLVSMILFNSNYSQIPIEVHALWNRIQRLIQIYRCYGNRAIVRLVIFCQCHDTITYHCTDECTNTRLRIRDVAAFVDLGIFYKHCWRLLLLPCLNIGFLQSIECWNYYARRLSTTRLRRKIESEMLELVVRRYSVSELFNNSARDFNLTTKVKL